MKKLLVYLVAAVLWVGATAHAASFNNAARTIRFEDANPNNIRISRNVQFGANAIFVQGTKGCLTIYYEFSEPAPSVTYETWGVNITAPENHALAIDTDRFGNPAVCKENYGLKWSFNIPGSYGQWGFICMPDDGNWCDTAKETKTDMPTSSVNAGKSCN